MHVQQVEAQARRAVEEAESRTPEEVTQDHSQASQEIAAFRLREEALLKQVQDLSKQLADSQNQFARDQMRLNGTVLEQKVDQRVEKMASFEVRLNDVHQRLVALESWGEEPIEEFGRLFVPLFRVCNPQKGPQSQNLSRKTMMRRIHVYTCPRWKDVSSVRMPALPDSAGGFRAWKNAFLPLIISLDSSDESHLYQWLLQAFNARSPQDITHL